MGDEGRVEAATAAGARRRGGPPVHPPRHLRRAYAPEPSRRGGDITDLTLEKANAIIDAAFRHSAERGFRPMAVVVVDESGNVKSAQRQDGASMFRVDVATGKAWGAVAFGSSSRELAERAADNPNFFVSLASTAGGRFLPQAGAVLIRDESGAILGAVGASGGSGGEDEEICAHGVTAAGLRHD